jgi:hypothetical protein
VIAASPRLTNRHAALQREPQKQQVRIQPQLPASRCWYLAEGLTRRAPRARGARLLRVDRHKELFRWRAKRIVELDRYRHLLEDKLISLGEYGVLGRPAAALVPSTSHGAARIIIELRNKHTLTGKLCCFQIVLCAQLGGDFLSQSLTSKGLCRAFISVGCYL